MFLEIENKRRMNPAAVQDDGAVITYGELTGFARETYGLTPERSLVFLMCKNKIGALTGYVACMSARNVPLLLNADIDKELLKTLIDTYDPDYIWMEEPEAQVGNSVCGNTSNIDDQVKKKDNLNVAVEKNDVGVVTDNLSINNDEKVSNSEREEELNIGTAASMVKTPSREGDTVEVVDGVKGEVVLSRYNYELIRLKDEEEIKKLTREPSDAEILEGKEPRLHPELALLMTTSGSTGSPKLVRMSYRNVFVNAAAITDYLEIDGFERAITSLPMAYTYGLSVINSHLLAGAELLLTDISYTQRGFWDFFKKEKATSMAGVPYTYEILDKMRFERMMLPSLKTMTQAGGRLRPDLHEKFAELLIGQKKKFFVMYGQTEATARMTYLPYTKALDKVGSIGVPIPGASIYLVDDDGKVVEKPGEPGELIYTGNNVTMGYAECLADLAKGNERDGILHTGDLAKFDEDGYLYIVGRKNRFLKIFGNRVNLDECEKLIELHYQVEAACTGEDDLMKIYVTGKIGEQVIRDFISEKTGLNPSAFEIHEVKSIPRSGSGKKAYVELE